MAEQHKGYYRRAECAVFRKTHEAFGGLSNMASGYPLRVNGHLIRTTEALYQACRYPKLPEVQRLIIDQASPMAAKMYSKPNRDETRPDWEDIKVRIMRWCLRIKLAQNWSTFGALLQSTGDRDIVEESRRDGFWGAIPEDDDTLVGDNVLGRLLMELRENLRGPNANALRRIDPVPIPDFLLFSQPVEAIDADLSSSESLTDPDREPPEGALWRLPDRRAYSE